MLSICLPEAIEERLAILASKTGRTKAFYAREAIINNLEDLEDYYLAEEILSNIRKGVEKTYTSKEVRESLGLED